MKEGDNNNNPGDGLESLMKLGLDYRAGGEQRRKKTSRSRAESVTIGTRSTTACWARERSPNYYLLYTTYNNIQHTTYLVYV